MIIVCECGAKLELDAVQAIAYFNGQAGAFWRRHGHAPGTVTYTCECGAQRLSGPRQHPRGGMRAMMSADLLWHAAHQACLWRGRIN